MYKRILLATDDSREGLVALREGALLAVACGSKAFLLVIDLESAGARVASGVYPVATKTNPDALLSLGLSRLSRLGVPATGQWAAGEPALIIADAARKFGADLIVVGHRRQTILERWWSGASGAHIIDNVSCSVLIARKQISDEEFEELLAPLSP